MNVPFDVRYGFRKLNNNFGFTAVAVGCLALGIGASITVFSVANAVLLRPITGVERPEQMVSLVAKPMVFEEMPSSVWSRPLSYPTFLRYREGSRTLSHLTAYHPFAANLVASGEPLRLTGEVVSTDYFATLGLRSALGRFFALADGERKGPPELVISHSLWQGAFSRKRLLVGNPIRLNDKLFTVIGIAPAGFRGTVRGEEVDLWVRIEDAPLIVPHLRGGKLADPAHEWLVWFFGRLAPGVRLDRAQEEMTALARRLGEGLPKERRPPPLQLHPGVGVRPGLRHDLASRVALLAAAVGLLMLVVCANLGGLLLVKAAARQEEIGVRLALGVSRARLIRQLLTESVALSLLGGAVGLLLAVWALDALEGISLAQYLPRLSDLSVDRRVVAFALGLSLATGVLFGLLPALWATRRQAAVLLRHANDAAAGQDRGRNRLQEMFVIGQVTISLTLLILTGLFVRTLVNLRSLDPGFDSRRVLNLRLDLSLRDYPPLAGLAFYEQLLANVRKLSGIRSTSLASQVPLSSANDFGELTRVQPAEGLAGSGPLVCEYQMVSPDYFQTMGISLLRGRDFTARDRRGSLPVAIVDATLARTLWPGVNPLGRRLRLASDEVLEVVGVARGVRLSKLGDVPQSYFYVPLAQHYAPTMILQVKTAGNPLRAAGAVRSVVRRLDPYLGIKMSRYGEEVSEALAQPRLFSWLFGSFSLVALIITAIGLYGTLAQTVSRRTRELGIRMALGARGSEIVGMVLRRGLALTLTGLILGILAASWTTSVFAGLLFGVTPTDLGVFASVTLLLILVGLVASSLPAYTATRVDPMAVIRHE